MFLMRLGVHRIVSAFVYVFVHLTFSAAFPVLPRSYFTSLLWQCYDSDLFAGWSEAGTIYAGHVADDAYPGSSN